jgi:hypothetical protein
MSIFNSEGNLLKTSHLTPLNIRIGQMGSPGRWGLFSLPGARSEPLVGADIVNDRILQIQLA